MADKPDPDKLKARGGLGVRLIHEQVQRERRPSRRAAGSAWCAGCGAAAEGA
jgi:hypothetical protein